jgi:hypothetical protein
MRLGASDLMMLAATSDPASIASRLNETANNRVRRRLAAANSDTATAAHADAGPRNAAARSATMKDAETEACP